MTQRVLDPRMLDTGTALPAISGANLTGLPTVFDAISTTAISGAECVISGLTTHDNYMFVVTNMEPATHVAQYLNISTDNGSTWVSSEVSYAFHGYSRTGVSSLMYGYTAGSPTNVQYTLGNLAYPTNLTMMVYGSRDGLNLTSGLMQIASDNSGANGYYAGYDGWWRYPDVSNINAYRFRPASGTFNAGGTVCVYGFDNPA